MLYGFRILRSYGIRTYKLQSRKFASPEEIQFWSSGKIRIFAGFDFSGLIPIWIDGESNSEWKFGITLENWTTETGFMVFQSFLNSEDFPSFLSRTQTFSSLSYIFGCPMSCSWAEDSKNIKHASVTSLGPVCPVYLVSRVKRESFCDSISISILASFEDLCQHHPDYISFQIRTLIVKGGLFRFSFSRHRST